MVFASFPQIFLDERPVAEVVTCFIGQIAVCIERIQGVVDDHNEFIFVVADKVTDLGEIHRGISVIGKEEVKFFVRLGLPETKDRFPSCLHRCVRFDFGKSFSFESDDRFYSCFCAADCNHKVCSVCSSGTCGQTPSTEIVCLCIAIIFIRRTCADCKNEFAVKAFAVSAVGASCIKPTGLSLLYVVLSIVNGVVAAVVVGCSVKQVFR